MDTEHEGRAGPDDGMPVLYGLRWGGRRDSAAPVELPAASLP